MSARKRLHALTHQALWSFAVLALLLGTACSKSDRSAEEPAAGESEQMADYERWGVYYTTSLHRTGQGKQTFYDEDPHGGFEQYVGVPYEELACKGCHTPGIGGAAKGERGCLSCHETDDPTKGAVVDVGLEGACGTCHSRQKAEAALYEDVHRTAGMDCMSCHSLEDVHGDGTVYNSMLEEGAIDAACSDCHPSVSPNDYHTLHSQTLACNACHMQSVVTCNNCHIETELVTGAKLAYGQFSDWRFLVNRDGKVHSGNYQSLIYHGKSIVAFAPFHAHTIRLDAVKDCSDCHGNEAVTDWFEDDDHRIDVVVWDPDGDDPHGKNLTHMTGIIPVPPNFAEGGLRFDFVTLTEIGSGEWEFVKTGADTYQILYATPLTEEQMEKIR